MLTLSEYGELFREAYAAIHGGRTQEPTQASPADAAGTLTAVRERLAAARPPGELAEAHEMLLRLLDGAASAEEALTAQVEAYRAGRLEDAIAHSERLGELVGESAHLDRELLLALRETERRSPGALALADIGAVTPISPDEG